MAENVLVAIDTNKRHEASDGINMAIPIAIGKCSESEKSDDIDPLVAVDTNCSTTNDKGNKVSALTETSVKWMHILASTNNKNKHTESLSEDSTSRRPTTLVDISGKAVLGHVSGEALAINLNAPNALGLVLTAKKADKAAVMTDADGTLLNSMDNATLASHDLDGNEADII